MGKEVAGAGENGRGRLCRERSRGAGGAAAEWEGGPGAWVPRALAGSRPTCPPGGGVGWGLLLCSVSAQRGQAGVLSWKLRPRAECWQEVASMTHIPQTRWLCHTQRLALSPFEAT